MKECEVLTIAVEKKKKKKKMFAVTMMFIIIKHILQFYITHAVKEKIELKLE